MLDSSPTSGPPVRNPQELDTANGLSSLLTVIITTSPTPSAPSTELLSNVLQSFRQHCPCLLDCRVVVVFDHYDQIVPLARLKKGYVTADQAGDYGLYKDNVKRLIQDQFRHGHATCAMTTVSGEAEFGSPGMPGNFVPFVTTRTADARVTFIEPVRRLGFGLAVRSALRATETPYVWVQQHDWTVVCDVPVGPLLDVMRASEADEVAPVKYVCLSAPRMLSYATHCADNNKSPVLRGLTATLRREFCPSSHQNVRIPLTPMFFWHDKPHIASTEHYLKRVYPTRLAMLRGDFIEDKIGQRARDQMKQGLWANWLYYPDEGKQLCLRHLNGRIFRGLDAESQKVIEHRDRNHQESLLRKTKALRTQSDEEPDDFYQLTIT